MKNSSRSIDELVESLQLEPHPEGGYFRETWRSSLTLPATALPDHPDERSAGTCIIYLLPAGAISKLHRVRSDELWLYQMGDSLRLGMAEEVDGDLEERLVGPQEGEHLQTLVPAGWWQTATPCEGPAGFTIVACVVVPGFDFDDFEMLGEDD